MHLHIGACVPHKQWIAGEPPIQYKVLRPETLVATASIKVVIDHPLKRACIECG
jgi:hypothetical protein